MKLILQKDLKNLGKAGDQINVKPGFARNYLLPRGMALVCDKKNKKSWQHKLQIIQSRRAQALKERKTLISKLESVQLQFSRAAKDKQNCFGSVTSVDISKELDSKGFSVDKRDIQTEPIKTFGKHAIKVSLGDGLTTNLNLNLSPQETAKQEEKSGFFKKLFSTSEKTESAEDSLVDSVEEKQEEASSEEKTKTN